MVHSFDCFRFGFSVLFALLGLGQCGTLRVNLLPVLCPVSVLDFRAGYASNLFTSVDGSVDVPSAHYARCKACDKQLDRTQDTQPGHRTRTQGEGEGKLADFATSQSEVRLVFWLRVGARWWPYDDTQLIIKKYSFSPPLNYLSPRPLTLPGCVCASNSAEMFAANVKLCN